MTSSLTSMESHCALSVYPTSQDNRMSVSSSVSEPREIYKNCLNSFLDLLAAPSAMLTGTETAARLICETIPNFSLVGKESVRRYNSFTNVKLFCQATNFLCGFINNDEYEKAK